MGYRSHMDTTRCLIPPAEHPERLIHSAVIERFRAAGGHAALAEIAGRDSVAAAIAAARESDITLILPTVVHTATEFGDFSAPDRVALVLAERLAGVAEVLPAIHLGSPRLWAALNSRFGAEIVQRFGAYSPCAACHLYMHLCRIPLSQLLGDAPVIAGERATHGGRPKVSQTTCSIDASIEVLAHAGITLLQPIRNVADNDHIAGIVGAWSGDDQLACVHSGNYVGIDGGVLADNTAFDRFTREFALPAGMAIVEAWRTNAEPDYQAIVAGVLRDSERTT